MSAVRLKVTQYGLSAHAGGWDPDGDSSTDQWQGNHANLLTTASCALTASAEDALARSLLLPHAPPPGPGLRLPPGTLLRVEWDDKHWQYRAFDDRAPEVDPRLDLFNPWAFDRTVPGDYASISVVLTR